MRPEVRIFWTTDSHTVPVRQGKARFRARTEIRRDGTDPGRGMSFGSPEPSQRAEQGPVERVPPGERGRPVMAALLVTISFVLFTVGFLLGALIVVAVGIRAEDKAAMRRRDGSILLHEEPMGHLSRGVRRLTGAGQRNGPRRSEDQ